MKPFITPEWSATGKKILRLQCEGLARLSLATAVLKNNVIAFAMPEGQTCRAAWLFQVLLDDGKSLEFSSACTLVADWQEVGSLNIRMVNKAVEDMAGSATTLSQTSIAPFCVNALDILVYEDDDVISECGIVICGLDGDEVVVAAGIPPGSVSIANANLAGSFEPQFSAMTCTRVRIHE